jgi:hypothetical protein
LISILPGALLGQTIAGTVADATSHQALGGVIVTATRAGLPPASQTVVSGPDGSFEFAALPKGTYTFCAQVPAGGYLDPCNWGAVPLQVSLPAVQSSGIVVRMVAGSVVHVRVQDPQQLLSSTSIGALPDLAVGVWGQGYTGSQYYPAHVAGKDAAGLDYEVTIRRDVPVALHIASRHLKLADISGAAIAGNASQENFQHNTGDANPKSFTWSITEVIP